MSQALVPAPKRRRAAADPARANMDKLGIAGAKTALTAAAVRAAFKKQSRAAHPDRRKGAPAVSMEELVEARDELLVYVARAAPDVGAIAADFDEERRREKDAADAKRAVTPYVLALAPADLTAAAPGVLAFSATVAAGPCVRCAKRGFVDLGGCPECAACSGTGRVRVSTQVEAGSMRVRAVERACARCFETGRVVGVANMCGDCGTTGATRTTIAGRVRWTDDGPPDGVLTPEAGSVFYTVGEARRAWPGEPGVVVDVRERGPIDPYD